MGNIRSWPSILGQDSEASKALEVVREADGASVRGASRRLTAYQSLEISGMRFPSRATINVESTSDLEPSESVPLGGEQ